MINSPSSQSYLSNKSYFFDDDDDLSEISVKSDSPLSTSIIDEFLDSPSELRHCSSNPDINDISVDQIVLFGDLKTKTISDSTSWKIQKKDNITIERITGHGKLFCGTSIDSLHIVYDSTSDDKELRSNTKSIQLFGGKIYYFKYLKFTKYSKVILAYRNKYNL
ncbi:predicted protein [Naegleria gruberi]|uniref:Predicted protein n=1 Tax=Naegleria gruberi TaxID=5762 RepID=D2V0N1_NAEGR|nr:uncharacterized protein NAEGRDRAFT_62352 [Naegleria gruberi]EFC49752.1 predicted protein [Naegleria gruberi]|eukprot:XP_002682496.1 predicted protein [Naegleria gruberi strain NEG-M]